MCSRYEHEIDILNYPTSFLVSIDHRLTLCQSRYNHVSDINERGRPVPLCERDGSFKTTQCNSVTGECWCVDEEGNEKPETRKVGDPNCEPKGKFDTYK